MKHTQGKLTVDESGTGLHTEAGFMLIDCPTLLVHWDWARKKVKHWSEKPGETYLEIDEEQAEANAERIKVLWNAMDGLSNEQVEALIPAIQKAEQKVLDFAHERDMGQFGTWASIFNELRLITRSKK